ncbi:pheromone precursor [Trametes coccinea BRFM310]|uniref:Pheromone n=1 Tax=Trametes coccinea (strain BRFM310) TaxID=1353009 RepID=A0A1Y2IRP6_TRAC3|nr:pheromone precursor [Trametes coccinea BRFM310]
MDDFENVDWFVEPEGLAPVASSRTYDEPMTYDVPIDAEHQPTTSHFWCIIA